MEHSSSENTSGAIFLRADLHIHSYGFNASYDVADENMTVSNIIDTAINEKLNIISITDHNSIGNVMSALEYSINKEILVVPGVELSTIQGHILFYFSDYDKLDRFFGKLNFSDDRKICNNGIVECLNIAKNYNGFGIAAHIDEESGFEFSIPKYNQVKEEILKNNCLLGLEISNKDNINWYSIVDNNVNRKNLIELRKKYLKLEDSDELAKVMSSDSHSVDSLGKNASGNKKLTRIKMDELSFDALKIAFLDSSSRIRVEEFIPEIIPKFVRIEIEGGFLGNQQINFSNNLNCIIGGRGAGKSTLFETIRAASGNASKSSLVNCEIWPDRINLIYEDEAGREFKFLREKNNDLINATDPMNGITRVPIESYGQGETASKIQNCDKDPYVLLSFFDEFIDFGNLKIDEQIVRKELLDNQSNIENLEIDVRTIPEIEKIRNDIESKIEILKRQKVGDIVNYQENLMEGKRFREELVTKLKELIKKINEAFADKTLFEQVTLLDNDKLVIGKDEFSKIQEIITNFSQNIDNLSTELNIKTSEIIPQIKKLLKEWESQEIKLLNKIDEKRKELEAKGIKLDLPFIQKVTQDSVNIRKRLDDLYKKKRDLKNALDLRKKLVEKRKDLKSRIFRERYSWAININESLKNTVVDYFIKVKFNESLLSTEYQDFIKETMGWRKSQVPKAKLLSEHIPAFKLISIINKKELGSLTGLKDKNNSNIFSKQDSNDIIEILGKKSNLYRLESIPYEDFPEITVTKVEESPMKEKQYKTKDFTKLSLGQQQSVLLSILLYSKSRYPLIIDQPEDNLDSEFIYKTIVKNLKRIKEFRQVIIVTHNANIAVLGDTELILPLKSSSEKAYIIDRGSIDNEKTKNITCDILEGSEQAFKKRMQIYRLNPN